MAVDMFLKLEGIKGEAKDDKQTWSVSSTLDLNEWPVAATT